MADQTTALTTVQGIEGQKPGLVSTLADFFGVAPGKFLEAIRSQVFPKGQATTDQLIVFLIVVNEYKLNPFLKEIYAFPDKWGNVKPVVSVDGWVTLVNRHQQNDGFEFEEILGTDGKPLTSTCILWVKGRSHPVKITEAYAECYRDTDPWNTMPRRMLRHKSLIQAARYAFGFSGIQDEDEARDAITVEPVRIPPAIVPPANVADIETQKKIAEFHSLADAAGMNQAQKHMMLGELGLDAALEKVKSLAPTPSASSAKEPGPAAPKRGKKGKAESQASEPAPAPAKSEEPQPKFGF